MRKVVIESATLYCGDCMEGMKAKSLKQFRLAIVDPPYGLGSKITSGGTWSAKYDNKGHGWDVAPDPGYFAALKATCENQIIWGANYFDCMAPSRGFIMWDKGPCYSSGQSFAECEYAWTSFDRNSKICRVQPLMGALCIGEEERIHPTQKPVKLYRWLLANYASTGDTILDTHMGSGSSVIACLDMGFPVTAYEIDEEMFEKACGRIERALVRYRSQPRLAL